MSAPVVVTEPESLREIVGRAVERAMIEHVPDAIREASAPEWMGRDAVCERYGLTPRQLTYMRDKNAVEYTQHGRRILYNRESLEGWIEEGRVKTRNGNGHVS